MNAKVKAALIDHYIRRMGLPAFIDELAWRLGVYSVRTLIEIVNLLSERYFIVYDAVSGHYIALAPRE